MYKKLDKIVISHLMIILFWGLLFKNKMLVEGGPILNAVSLILFFTLYGLIYTEISNKKIPRFFSILVIFTSLLPLSLILINDFPYKVAFALISLASTSVFIKRYVILENIKYINILPISRKSTQIFTIGLVFFIFAVIYLFDIEQVMINIFTQIIFLIMEIFFILFLKEKELAFENTFKLYYLSDYMTSERDEFARIIHDDIIQDIFASRNYLSSKNPNIEYSKNILSNLEEKARKIMKFYQSSLFEKANLETSILAIFDNVSSLYPNRNIKIQRFINRNFIEDKRIIRLISIVSKELINNIYKHSEAKYLSYKLYKKENCVLIEIDSDGVSREDFNNIKESRRGVLLLNLLIGSNSGNIIYELNKDILSTRVYLEVDNSENYFVGRS
ncbi:histidine kinase [Anaerococcus porci]|uniref:histidine kinase n=1 Tax=Anaerococcus porci TaxID=2652269 RepID=UPI002A74E510|nr:histidine kinase [Anaerococcus porci]MDY3006694.1 histidine kinase [Anaerococcus porci]